MKRQTKAQLEIALADATHELTKERAENKRLRFAVAQVRKAYEKEQERAFELAAENKKLRDSADSAVIDDLKKRLGEVCDELLIAYDKLEFARQLWREGKYPAQQKQKENRKMIQEKYLKSDGTVAAIATA